MFRKTETLKSSNKSRAYHFSLKFTFIGVAKTNTPKKIQRKVRTCSWVEALKVFLFNPKDLVSALSNELISKIMYQTNFDNSHNRIKVKYSNHLENVWDITYDHIFPQFFWHSYDIARFPDFGNIKSQKMCFIRSIS